MVSKQHSHGTSRADQRIPNLRTRGRANRIRLLEEAQRLIESADGKPIRFSEVFEAAGVSRGSAYRIYDGVDDLMRDLATTWINNFVAHIRETNVEPGVESWTELSDLVVARSVQYWHETEQILRSLPRVHDNVPENYRRAVKEMTTTVADIFNQHFEVPEIPDWHSVIGMYFQLGDSIFADAVRRNGRVNEQRLMEAQKICSTYLSFYLPSWLPPRGTEIQ